MYLKYDIEINLKKLSVCDHLSDFDKYSIQTEIRVFSGLCQLIMENILEQKL